MCAGDSRITASRYHGSCYGTVPHKQRGGRRRETDVSTNPGLSQNSRRLHRGLTMLGVMLGARAFLERVGQELLRVDEQQVKKLADLVYQRYLEGKFVFVIGNGGSGSNASHLCEDLGKCTLRREDFDSDNKKRLKVLSLT